MIHGCGLGNSMFMGGGVFMFIFWILIAGVIIWMFSRRSTGNGFKLGVDRKETPMEILKKRDALEELKEDEYEYESIK